MSTQDHIDSARANISRIRADLRALELRLNDLEAIESAGQSEMGHVLDADRIARWLEGASREMGECVLVVRAV